MQVAELLVCPARRSLDVLEPRTLRSSAQRFHLAISKASRSRRVGDGSGRGPSVAALDLAGTLGLVGELLTRNRRLNHRTALGNRKDGQPFVVLARGGCVLLAPAGARARAGRAELP